MVRQMKTKFRLKDDPRPGFLHLAGADIFGTGFHLWKCPKIPPKKDINMRKMLGTWYVIHKSSPQIPCQVDVFGDVFNKRNDTFYVDHIRFELDTEEWPGEKLKKYIAIHDIGKLRNLNLQEPADMTVEYLNGGTYSFTVFATDYNNYAGILTCSNVLFGHTRSVSFLSRFRVLNVAFVIQLVDRLVKSEIYENSMGVVYQNNCPKPPDRKLLINPNAALSAKALNENLGHSLSRGGYDNLIRVSKDTSVVTEHGDDSDYDDDDS